MCYSFCMNLMDSKIFRLAWCKGNGMCLAVVLCVCVVAQMLGAPFTLLDLLSSDMLAESELVSEDFSSLSSSPDPERPRLLHSFTELRSVLHLPLLSTSVFRPPSK